MTLPLWYQSINDWLLAKGWTPLVVVALIIVAFTLFLIWKRQAAPLALWLTYLLSP